MIAEASRRVRRECALERERMLDHGVNLLLEDGWRNPYSTHPLRPRYRRRYPFGKQVSAQMRRNHADDRFPAMLFLSQLQDEARARVARQMVEADAVRARRLRAAQNPLAVIEPRSSVPGVAQVIAELEKRTHLPIEEIRACFRQGRRSVTQQFHRAIVDDAIRAMVKHHRMVHPVSEKRELYGTRQWDQARAAWREFTGQRLQDQLVRQRIFDVFGGSEGDDRGWGVEHGPNGRDAGTRRLPQIVDRLAEALRVHPDTVRGVLAKTPTLSPRTVEGQNLSCQEAS